MKLTKSEKMKLTKSEEKQIEAARKEKENYEKCIKLINDALNKYGYQISVDPRSPIANPQVILKSK